MAPKVIVVGGGIGGLCLAHALRGAGVAVRVYERDRDPDDPVRGYRIHVNQMGSRSLRQCLPAPLWEAFLATAGHPGPGFRFQDERLRELLFVEEALMSGGSTAPADVHHAASRAALRRLLLAGLDGVVRFGKVFERYETEPDGRVTARFSDGTSATGDLLVGADGANSAVRRQYLPGPGRVVTDAVGFGARLPLTEATRKWVPAGFQAGLNLVLPSRGCAMFTASFTGRRQALGYQGAERLDRDLAPYGLDLASLTDDLEDYVLLAVIAHRRAIPPGAAGLDGEGLKSLVAGMTPGWHPGVRRMVAEADPATVQLMPFKTSTPVPAWPTTAVTLLGDAVHSMPPVMGFGANVAMRDAALLSSVIAAVHRGEDTLTSAVRSYEKEMLDYGFGAVRTAGRMTDLLIAGSPLVRNVAKGWLRACAVAGPLKRMSFGTRWTDETRQEPERVAARLG
ncbi:NAD(P)/FAD-dependent oxidoreductase [Sphaerisporangium sp. TRM90804]|uniref:FAD-dependent oxidoreductase n=1 Tax=Sphaerisporangium sp. TRM90804 TaxID=3031113 RepID=UPI00244D7C1B|nr:NAD(P)/FAD-dependent oxidoreductase [Sphaerisporangium sp. TRM90804]MDH2427735.1 NAD(P)/FAD-dependent oxidoreductase [Sphaerisporangium sp. TRM90804]